MIPAKRYVITLKYEPRELSQRMYELHPDGAARSIVEDLKKVLDVTEESNGLVGRIEHITVDELR